jgi:hypothetical protein
LTARCGGDAFAGDHVAIAGITALVSGVFFKQAKAAMLGNSSIRGAGTPRSLRVRVRRPDHRRHHHLANARSTADCAPPRTGQR